VRIPEHPIIRNMERYGYPEPWDPPVCPKCQGELHEDDTVYLYQGRWICRECFIEDVTEFVKCKTDEFAEEYGHDTKEVVYD
jgi:hypothetical protein